MGELERKPWGAAAGEDFREVITSIARAKRGHLEVFGDFTRVVACCLAAETREDEYLEVVNKYRRDELHCFSAAMANLVTRMEAEPFHDLLGVYYTEINSSVTAASRGEFYTPGEVSEAVARMLVDVDQVKEKGKPITVSDPACGSGGMILALAKQFAPGSVDLLRVTCQDISPLACDMAYINTTLWGIPAHIIQGNTLTLEVERAWKNIHWHRVGEEQRLALERAVDLSKEVFSGGDRPKEKPAITVPKPQKQTEDHNGQTQLGLDFG